MTITKGNINTNVTLTALEQRAKAITGKTKAEILLLFRYKPIAPVAETYYHYFYDVHNYITVTYKVDKDKCVTVDDTIYCPCTLYAKIKA